MRLPNQRGAYVYLMMNKGNTVIYTGVTSDLKKRVYEHRNHLVDGFTKRYRVCKLVYFECYTAMEEAILREKQIKAGSRWRKMSLIQSSNPTFRDLYNEL